MQERYLSNQLKRIYPYLFYGCGQLSTIEIPASVTVIGNSAFQKTGLTEVIIPENISKIGSKAFRDCKNLQSVYFAHQESLPEFSAVDLIFTGCTNLEYISVATEEMALELQLRMASMSNLNPKIEVRMTQEEKPTEPEVVPPIEDEEEKEKEEEEIKKPTKPEIIPPVEDEKEMVVISTSSASSYIWVQQPQMFSAGYKQAALNWLGEWYREWQEGERILRILRQKYLGSNEQQLLLPHYREVSTFQ